MKETKCLNRRDTSIFLFFTNHIIDDFNVGKDDENDDFDSFHRHLLIVNQKTCQLETKKTIDFAALKVRFIELKSVNFGHFTL